jgi:predicted dehydrogenase
MTRHATRHRLLFCAALLVAVPATGLAQTGHPEIRIGIIGLDTSHGTAFTRLFHEPRDSAAMGFRVVAAYPHGSATIESSYSRIPRYTEELRGLGVEIVGSIAELLQRSDVVLLLTNDGHPRLEQALQVIAARKPLFADKPIAASLADAVRIYDAAERASVPIFSASGLRFMPSAQAVRRGSIGEVVGADAYGPGTLEPSHPDLYWYGIHAVETLVTAMGPGCESVRRTYTEDTDLVVCVWGDGRVGTMRGIRKGRTGYGGTAFGSEGIATLGPFEGYRELVAAMGGFFRTGIPPVSAAETLEIYAIMDAADGSKLRGGEAVDVREVLREARRRAAGGN